MTSIGKKMKTKVSLLLEMNKLYFGRILLRSRDLVASGVKCGPHGGMNSKMTSWTVSWLSLKTKVKPRLRGSQVMSGDWRRVHRVRGVSGGSPENHWVPWLIHKAKTEEPKTVL
jgi:hypothetical protein